MQISFIMGTKEREQIEFLHYKFNELKEALNDEIVINE